jgi:5-methylcytosine-specific restriction endonuclease McrA
MQQMGWKLGGSSLIDTLTYSYYTNSNKLQNVIDGNDALTTLGDFHTSALSPYYTNKTSSAIDYTYDANGNLTRDLNKDIGTQSVDGIVYNHLNLPYQVKVRSATGAKGTITYIYDATGNKLKKTTMDSAGSVQTVTTYLGGFVYQSKSAISTSTATLKDTLQFFAQEEGRVRVATDTTGGQNTTSFKYDYFIKDHLGNTRMVLTDERQTDMYPAATMEVADSATENLYYSKLDSTRTGLPAGYPTDTTTNPNNYAAKVGGFTGPKIGPGITLKVMAGDQFSIKATSWYSTNGTQPGTAANPLNDLLAALISGVGGLPGGHLTATQLQANSTVISPNITQFLQDTGTSIIDTKPHAFVNWVLFDNQFNYVSASSGFDQVGDDQEFKQHALINLPVTQSGYLYIYLSNTTSNIDVFFDNLQVSHVRGPLLEETHFYPFGLTMAGISDKALKANYAENKIRFQKQELQNKEFSDGSGLEMYEFKYRFDDPQTGRFWSVDPLADQYVYNSPYAFSEDKVTGHVELEGLEAVDFRIEKDLQDVQSGKITTDQLSDRLNVRGKSDLLAAGLGILSVLLGPEETFGLGRFIFGAAKSSPEQEAKTPQNAPKSQEVQKAEDRAAKLSEKPREGKDFTKAGKDAVKDLNKAKNAGKMKCEDCGVEAKDAAQHTKGEKPSSDEAHVDHIDPKAKGGSGTPDNGQVLCRDCNLKKGAN